MSSGPSIDLDVLRVCLHFLANSDCSLRKTVKSNTNLTRTVFGAFLVVVGNYEFIRETIDCQFRQPGDKWESLTE